MGSCQDKHLDPAQCAQRQEKGISHDLLVKLYEKHPEAYKKEVEEPNKSPYLT